MTPKVERRSAEANWEVREAPDGKVGLRGYAAVFDQPSNGEVIRRTAFTRTLAHGADVRLFFDHGGLPLARTASGTMTLTVDEHGLIFDVPELDVENSQFARDVAASVRRGDLSQCSFAFIPVRESYDKENQLRCIEECKLVDVSVVSLPWYPSTSVDLKGLDLALAEVRSGSISPEARDLIMRALDGTGMEDDPAAEEEPQDGPEDETEPTVRDMCDYLNVVLADVVTFYYRAHAAHWNVVGPDFAQYHDLFGHIYEDTYGSIDPLAENIRKCGGTPLSDIDAIMAARTIAPAPVNADARALAADLMMGNDLVIDCLNRAFEAAEEADEQGLANFLAERLDAHKGWRWQLAASLGIAAVPTRQTPEATEPRAARKIDIARTLYLR